MNPKIFVAALFTLLLSGCSDAGDAGRPVIENLQFVPDVVREDQSPILLLGTIEFQDLDADTAVVQLDVRAADGALYNTPSVSLEAEEGAVEGIGQFTLELIGASAPGPLTIIVAASDDVHDVRSNELATEVTVLPAGS